MFNEQPSSLVVRSSACSHALAGGYPKGFMSPKVVSSKPSDRYGFRVKVDSSDTTVVTRLSLLRVQRPACAPQESRRLSPPAAAPLQCERGLPSTMATGAPSSSASLRCCGQLFATARTAARSSALLYRLRNHQALPRRNIINVVPSIRGPPLAPRAHARDALGLAPHARARHTLTRRLSSPSTPSACARLRFAP